MSSLQKFFLTTPIYYVNARPHLGHTYTTVVADVLARAHRAQGEDVRFLTGTDEHGQKIQRSARALGRSPQEFTDEVSAEFRGLWDRMGLSYDDYIRTTEPRHQRGVQRLFALLRERGFIYKGRYTGQYCVFDELYVDGPPGTFCPDCGRLTETVSEENYYFKLSAFERILDERIYQRERDGSAPRPEQFRVDPETRRNEVLSFIRGGLRDLSVSRTSFDWGVPVPDAQQNCRPDRSGAERRDLLVPSPLSGTDSEPKHVIYVWLDALANYITAIGWGSDDPADKAMFERYWPADLHIIGKEISRFHCVYWPAFLIAAGLPLPKAIVAHGWLLFEHSKMSKSRGNIVRAETVLEVLGADALRYFLLREVPFGQDGSFSFDALVQRYNSDLANGYGNLASRTLAMISQYFEGVIPGPSLDDSSTVEREAWQACQQKATAALQENNFSDALEAVWSFIRVIDMYLSAKAPWKAMKADPPRRDEVGGTLYLAADALRLITATLYPFLPAGTAKVWAQLGLGDIEEASKSGTLRDITWGGLKPGTKLGELGPVYPRADKDAVARMQTMEEQNSSKAGAPEAPENTGDSQVPEAPSARNPADPSGALATPPRAQMASSYSSSESSNAANTAQTGGPVPDHDAVAAAADTAGPSAASAGADSGRDDSVVEPASENAAAISSTSVSTPGSMPGIAQIGIDDFTKVELRVAQIKVAERVPKADKLLRLEVDLGYEQRQILAGIAESYEPEALIGRKIVIVANLAARKMRGLESNGMLLAASVEGGKAVLATFAEDIALGARLK